MDTYMWISNSSELSCPRTIFACFSISDSKSLIFCRASLNRRAKVSWIVRQVYDNQRHTLSAFICSIMASERCFSASNREISSSSKSSLVLLAANMSPDNDLRNGASVPSSCHISSSIINLEATYRTQSHNQCCLVLLAQFQKPFHELLLVMPQQCN